MNILEINNVNIEYVLTLYQWDEKENFEIVSDDADINIDLSSTQIPS